MYFVLLPQAAAPRLLIGSGGYKGRPVEGAVEIGYGMVPEQQRRGYASEAAFALIERAFAFDGVDCVAAQTLPGMDASLGVMRLCGMQPMAAPDPGALRYAITRAAFAALAARV
jgi:RimJ/RimL family protein N-acetyltransferase